jgi:hypothetical protein
MTGTGRERRTHIGGQFAPRLIEMLESPAFRVLSLSARRVLDRLEIELGHHGGTDNGRLPVTFENFQDYGMDRHAIAPAIRECEALGFIQVTERGYAGNADFRRPNLFRLTYSHTLKENPTHEWRAIKTPEEAELLARKARAVPPKKQKSNGGKHRISVGEKRTESDESSVRETTTTAMVEKPTLLSISGEGGR